MGNSGLGKMPAHRSDRSARQLVVKIAGVECLRSAGGQSFRLGKACEVTADFGESRVVDVHLMSKRAEIGNHALGRWIRNTVPDGTRRALNGANAPIGRVHVSEFADADRAVRMKLKWLIAD